MSNPRSIKLLANVKILTTLLVVFLTQTFVYGQEVTILEPGKSITRSTKSRQTDTYQVTLAAGQFIRVLVEKNEVDVTVELVDTNNQSLKVVNIKDYFGQESLSHEITTSGVYKVIIRTTTSISSEANYQIKLVVKDATSSQDKQRMTAEVLLFEGLRVGPKSPPVEQKLEKLQQALQSWRELNDKYWEAVTLQLIGRTYSFENKFDQANENLKQALAIQNETRDQLGKITTLISLGAFAHIKYRTSKPGIEMAQNLLYQAGDYYEQALIVSREIKHRGLERYTLQSLAAYYRTQNLHEKVIECYVQILRLDREYKNRPDEAQTLYRLGFANYQASHYDQALAMYDAALAIFLEYKNRVGEAETYREISNTYDSLGQYEKSLAYQEKALTIWRSLNLQSSVGGALGNIGNNYLALNRPEKAIEYYEQALTIFREGKVRQYEAEGLNNLGEAHNRVGNYAKSSEYLEQSLVLHRSARNRRNEAIALSILGANFFKQKMYEKAVEYYEQSLLLTREARSRDNEVIALNGLAETLRALGQLEKATISNLQALQIAREIKAMDNEASSLNGLLLDWKARNQPQLAILFGKQAVNLYQQMRSGLQVLDKEFQQGFLQSKEPTYRELADLLIAQGRLPEAEQVIRVLKEEEYFEYVRRDVKNAAKAEQTTLTPEEAAVEKRYREIADKLTEIGTQRAALLEKNTRTPEEEKQLVQLEADLLVAGQTFQKFLDGLSTEFAQKSDNQNRMFQVRESQGLMEDLRELGKGTVALYTLVGASKFRIILTTADVQKAYEYPIGEAELNRKILALREALQNPRLDPRPAAQELYRIVFAPVAKDLQAMKATTLMWSLDGVLRYVPISALYDGEKYLVETYRHVVFTPASNARLKDTVSKNWQALGLGVTKSFGDNIPALPAVAAEMRGIIRSEANGKGIMPGIVKLDDQFTQESMLTGLRARPSVVHVASHFQFKPGNETDSALLLGDGKFLSLAQIKALPNVFSGVELLTLSACNTATGGSGANGKEVEGFGVLAQRQGAKAVIASLWPVVDRTTRILMEEFYRSREANKLTKGEALRQAQLKLLRGTLAKQPEEDLASRGILHEDEKPSNAPKFKGDPKAPYAHPYYWAPFILIGNWK